MIDLFKEIITNYRLDKDTIFDKGCLYQFKGNEQIEGQLILTKSKSLLRCKSQEFTIDKAMRIIDNTSSQVIAYYKLSNWTIFTGYRDKLIWGDKEYMFKKIKPDVSYSLLKKETWGHFKFQLSSDNELVIYRFKIDMPTISLGNPYLEKSFHGQVALSNIDPLVALAGLTLIERALENETLLAE